MRHLRPGAGSVHAIDSPYAWRMTAIGFVTCFVVFGAVYSFGAFFQPLAAEFGAHRAGTSTIFSITAALYNALGFVSGWLSDRFGPRRVMLVGAVALGAGLIATAAAHTLAVAYITYGVGLGVGVAFTYIPALALVGGWFARRRNTAMGIAVSGTGAGTLILSPLAAAAIGWYGWRQTYVLMGVVGALALGACAMLAQPAPVSPVRIPRRRGHLTRSADFARLYIAFVLASISIYVPFVYLPDFAQSRGVAAVAAAALVGFVGAASIAGRLGLGPIADRTGIFPIFKASVLVLACSFAIWPLAHSYATLVLFAVVMGAAYGGMVSLSPTLAAELFGVEDLGTTLGALFSSSAISALAGPPLVGYAIDHGGSYLWAAVMGGGAGLIGFCILIPLHAAEPLTATLIPAK
ncbi:MAG: MCT family MFS transporter [Candidatus Binataceae bacterium]